MSTDDASLIQKLDEAQRNARVAADNKDAAGERRWNAVAKQLLSELKKTPQGITALRNAKTLQRD